MERRANMAKGRADAPALRQLLRDLEEARLLAVQAKRGELAESLAAWMERLQRDSRANSYVASGGSEYQASELWLG